MWRFLRILKWNLQLVVKSFWTESLLSSVTVEGFSELWMLHQICRKKQPKARHYSVLMSHPEPGQAGKEGSSILQWPEPSLTKNKPNTWQTFSKTVVSRPWPRDSGLHKCTEDKPSQRVYCKVTGDRKGSYVAKNQWWTVCASRKKWGNWVEKQAMIFFSQYVKYWTVISSAHFINKK